MSFITYNQKGYTLVELVVAVGIIGVLTSIALPLYNGYIATSAAATAQANAETLAGFEDAYFYENDTYLAGGYDPAGADTLTASLGWKPSGDKAQFTYKVEAGDSGAITSSCKITVTYKADTSIQAIIKKP